MAAATIESWDDDFAGDGDLIVPERIQNGAVEEQLDVVRSFAASIGAMEQVLMSIPLDKINDSIESDDQETILKALDLVALSKQDYTDRFFETSIGKEYIRRGRQQHIRELEMEVSNEMSPGRINEIEPVDIDICMVRKLASRAAHLLPQLERRISLVVAL